MSRLVRVIAAAFLAAVPVVLLSAPAVADTDDFVFDSFDADYYLGVDADGRSTLTTVETFVAVFPDADQNHGMRRAIPEEYRDAPTDVTVESVTDGDGSPRPFETESDDGFLLVTSREDGFVHGAQTYVFTYTQRNVTRFFENTGADEFYWDTNGLGWDQPFGSVTARVHVPDELASLLTGEIACYQGAEDSTTPCDVTSEPEEGGTVVTVSASDLGARENVTVAIGFDPQAFVERDDSYFASPAGVLQVVGVLASMIAAIWALVLRATRLADGRGRPTIIAEYTPPDGIDPVTASVLLGVTGRAAAATFIDLAVRRVIRIVETEKTGLFASGSDYSLELIDASGLQGTDLDLARSLFGHDLTPGATHLMSAKDTTLSEKVRSIITDATAAATTRGLRRKAGGGVLPLVLAFIAAVGTFIAGVVLLDGAFGGFVPALLFVPGAVAIVIAIAVVSRAPLTSTGAELRDHLKGLELYIRLAEADRLRMLQSPEGAERDGRVVDIYEKLLPYAVLFSLEKEWAEELGRYYTQQSPDWYSGSGAFNAGVFAASIGSVSTAAATSYSGSASSSSSGGSGGGGSSGGGGGGGGGGGV